MLGLRRVWDVRADARAGGEMRVRVIRCRDLHGYQESQDGVGGATYSREVGLEGC